MVNKAGGKRGPMKVLVLNSDLPVFPGWGGNEHLQTTGLSRLAEKVGLVSLVHTQEQAQKMQALASAGVEPFLWTNPSLGEPAQTRRRPPILRRVGRFLYDWPRSEGWRPRDTLIQDHVFRNLSPHLLRALCDETWNVVVVVQSTSARWLDYIPQPPASALVMHDVCARVYERMAMFDRSPLKWVEHRLEAARYRRHEARYCRRFDLVITVSSADEEYVRRHYHPNRLVNIPIPVDSGYFTPFAGVREREARILFTGMMNHPPNVDAACYYAQEVMPLVWAVVPQAEFWIVGRDPADEVRELGDLPGVVVTGTVPDIRPFIAEATVYVVPLRFGAGMRQKILEAWGMEKCVISSSVGAEGLEFKDGTDLIIADTAEAMARHTVECLLNPSHRKSVRANGRAVILRGHSPDNAARKYYRALTSTATEKRHEGLMRVVIDLRWMRPGWTGGIETLSRAFVHQLLELDRTGHYSVLVPSECRFDFDLRGRSNFRLLTTDGLSQKWDRVLWRGARSLHRRLGIDYWRSEDVETLRRARLLEADVGLSIPGYIHSDLYPLANVLVVPDIQHEFFPEFFRPEELEERRRIYRDSIRRARHICAISEFTRQTLIERLGVPPCKVRATPLAADPLFEPGNNRARPLDEVMARYDLVAGAYVYYPGNTWPHKNHLSLLRALRLLRSETGLDPLLVLTGSAKNAHIELLKSVQELGLEGRVRFLGYCASEDMPSLYRGAAGLVFPSLFEGFGMPVLEAMWSDCPVACSNVTSLPEVAGDAALLFDPSSPEEIAQAIFRMISDSGLRASLVERGREQARRFSWQTFTLNVASILRQTWEERYPGGDDWS